MPQSIKKTALRTISMEADSIQGLSRYINKDFEKAIRTILACKGRLIVSGIGKSAIIAQKIVATLNSTGTPSIFMHAAEAIHGDLGMVMKMDIVMIVSKSGNSQEIKALIPLVKNRVSTIIGMVGNTDSYLAAHSTIVLNTFVEQEACPNNLAPTTSTTAQMVLGDAIAVCLMELRGFNADDFAKFHPGGMLGKQLYLRISDIYQGNEKPAVLMNHSLKKVIVEITQKRLGATAVVDGKNILQGIITDGDLRRMLEKNHLSEKIEARNIMTPDPKTIEPGALALNAIEIMRAHEISQLVVAEKGKYLGMIHLHDLLREGFI